MNEKLLSMAKEKAFDIHVYEGEYAHHETEYTFSESGIVALLELVASTMPDNIELLNVAKAIVDGWDNRQWEQFHRLINQCREAILRTHYE